MSKNIRQKLIDNCQHLNTYYCYQTGGGRCRTCGTIAIPKKVNCYACQGGGCPVCNGSGFINS